MLWSFQWYHRTFSLGTLQVVQDSLFPPVNGCQQAAVQGIFTLQVCTTGELSVRGACLRLTDSSNNAAPVWNRRSLKLHGINKRLDQPLSPPMSLLSFFLPSPKPSTWSWGSEVWVMLAVKFIDNLGNLEFINPKLIGKVLSVMLRCRGEKN